ncbi:MAG: peptidylprolyl isomerase, partial [Abitibacteriaceae bacterium]|nr:peptidylprolyl isomerase [Abditibacteriaceae bacterium]
SKLAPATTSPAPATGAVAAEVNNDKIMVADVERLLNALKKQEPTLAGDSPADKAALQTWRGRILENLIADRLLYQEAQQRNIKPAPQDVDKLVQQVKGGFKNDQDFTQALAKEGLTPAYVRQSLTEELMRRELANQLTADITISEADIAKFYRDNPKEFTVPEYTKVSHILIAVQPNTSAADKKKAHDRAAGLLKQALGGADFAKLARENSEDPGSKDKGGELGPLEKDQFVKPFEDAAFATTPGKVYDKLAETQFGYHIIKTDKVAERIVPLSDLRDNKEAYANLKTALFKMKVQDVLDKHIEGLRAQAKIKKNI